jgi:hypothetical protein
MLLCLVRDRDKSTTLLACTAHARVTPEHQHLRRKSDEARATS